MNYRLMETQTGRPGQAMYKYLRSWSRAKKLARAHVTEMLIISFVNRPAVAGAPRNYGTVLNRICL